MMKTKQKKHSTSFSAAENGKTLHKNLDFTATEQYKLLRTNLGFTLPAGEKCPVIGVTSSIRGEGKSTTSINLSYVLAEKGSKVLLIDGDLRLPSVAKKMELDQKKGLTDFLMGQGGNLEDFRSPLLENWYIMTSGTIPPNPSELLGSSRMNALLTEFRKTFDYIVLDLPPVNLVSDAMSVAGYITGMVVVAREEYIEKKDLKACFRQLELSNVKILGCVMTCAKRKSGSYGKYGKYKRYKYYGHYGHNAESQKESGKGGKP
ncbi:MAG: CpsD/CapB family tyrosine-protein kinase [Clostridia bacterium]|nr:CpsD/CapB family tyrosine-protein kinase [Clostridia bacterium]